MSSHEHSLPGESARRWLARVFPPSAMEGVFDPFLADLQADWTEATRTRGARYARWCLGLAYASLVVQAATCALGARFGAPRALARGSAAPHRGGEIATARGSRYAAPLAFAGLITFGLFVLMSALIASQGGSDARVESTPIYLTPAPPKADPPKDTRRELPTPPEPILQPGHPGIPIDPHRARPRGPQPGPTDSWLTPFSKGYLGPIRPAPSADQDEIPIVRVAPVYPPRALARGIEGWVEVEFTITASGGVAEPRILRAHPSAIFNGAALRALERWKFQPKVVDGEPVSRPGVRQRLRFELVDGRSRAD